MLRKFITSAQKVIPVLDNGLKKVTSAYIDAVVTTANTGVEFLDKNEGIIHPVVEAVIVHVAMNASKVKKAFSNIDKTANAVVKEIKKVLKD